MPKCDFNKLLWRAASEWINPENNHFSKYCTHHENQNSFRVELNENRRVQQSLSITVAPFACRSSR